MALKFKIQDKTKTKAIFKRESNMHLKLNSKKFKTKNYLFSKIKTNKKVAAVKKTAIWQ